MGKSITIAIVCIVVIIGIIAFFLFKGCGKKSIVPISETDSTEVTYWKDLYNNEIASKRYTDEVLAIKDFKIDSLAKALRTKPKFIKEVVTIIQRGEAEVKTVEKPVIIRDTINNEINSVAQIFTSPYYQADVFIPLIGEDSSSISIVTFDTLTLVQKEVMEGSIFNRKRSIQFDIINANPYNKITGITAYRVQTNKQTTWSRWIKPVIVAGISGYIGYRVGKR